MKALAACAALVTACSAEAADPDEAKLAPRTAESGAPLGAVQQAMEVPHLALAITVEPALKSIRARAEYTVRAAAPLERVEFDLDPRFSVTEVMLGGRPLSAAEWSSREGLLSVSLPTPLPAGGEVDVAIAYEGRPREAPRAPWDGGFVWDKAGDGQPWIATAMQGEGCDLLWPCIDHPMGEPLLVDEAFTVPAPLVAPGNGVFIGMEEHDGWRTYRWRAKSPDTYAIVVNAGPYELL